MGPPSRPGRRCRLVAAPAASSGPASSCWRGARPAAAPSVAHGGSPRCRRHRRTGKAEARRCRPPRWPSRTGDGGPWPWPGIARASWRPGSRGMTGGPSGRCGGSGPARRPSRGSPCGSPRTTTWSWPGPPESGPRTAGPSSSARRGRRRRATATRPRASPPSCGRCCSSVRRPSRCRPRWPTSSGPGPRWASRTARRSWPGRASTAGASSSGSPTSATPRCPGRSGVPPTTPPSSTTCSSHRADRGRLARRRLGGGLGGGHVAIGPAGGALLTDELLPGQAGVIGIRLAAVPQGLLAAWSVRGAPSSAVLASVRDVGP